MLLGKKSRGWWERRASANVQKTAPEEEGSVEGQRDGNERKHFEDVEQWSAEEKGKRVDYCAILPLV